MNPRLLLGTLSLSIVVAGLAGGPAAVRATEIWSGRTFAFSKAARANPTLAANQDRITPYVWITRGSTMGLYNAYTEGFYTGFVSPDGTEWATGDAVNYGSLLFQPWENWVASDPPASVGVNAVVHLIVEDIYVDIVFDSWASGITGGGAFSYHRAVKSITTPAASSTWGRIKTLYR